MVLQRRAGASSTVTPRKSKCSTEAEPASSPGASAADGISISPYAARLPQPAATGVPEQDAAWNCWHRTMQQVISHLQANPDEVAPLWARMSSGEMSVSLKGVTAAEKVAWDDSVFCVGRLPKYWQAQVLCDCDTAPKRPVDKKICDLIDSIDSQGIQNIFKVLTATTDGTENPLLARRSKALCAQMFRDRLNEVGRLTGSRAACIDAVGTIKWVKAGPYALHWGADGQVKQIEWVSENIMKEVDVDIDGSFDLKDPWCVSKAMAQAGQVKKYMFEDFFDKAAKEGPHKFLADKKGSVLEGFAARVNEKIEAQAREIHEVCDEEDFVGSQRQEKRKLVLEQAQQKATAKMRKMRVVSLEAVAPVVS